VGKGNKLKRTDGMGGITGGGKGKEKDFGES